MCPESYRDALWAPTARGLPGTMSRSAEIRQMMIQQRVAEERKMLMATGELVDPDVHVEREGEVMLCVARARPVRRFRTRRGPGILLTSRFSSGNERTFNINTMLAENIRDSDYFNRQCLCDCCECPMRHLPAARAPSHEFSPTVPTVSRRRLREFEDIIQEAFDKLDHVGAPPRAPRELPSPLAGPTHPGLIQSLACDPNAEPWSAGSSRHPSTAFCLLMRLFVLRLTHSELNILLGNKRSPHVRAIGFLYIRYGLFRDPHLWDWLAPYVDDPEEFSPGVDGKKMCAPLLHSRGPAVAPACRHTPLPPPSTMGGFVRILLDEPKYYGTLLPRIPVPTMRKIRAKVSGRPPARR